MGALQTLQAVAKAPHQVAEDWKAAGKKVVGYRCLYVPEEIIWAAGMLPYPLYGTPEPVTHADAFFQSCCCEFVRNLWDHAEEGKLDMLDAFAVCNTCDVVRRLYDMWDAHRPQTPVVLINNPQKLADESNRDYYMEELSRFRARMGEVAGVPIEDAAIDAAIILHNRTRELLRRVYALREEDPPPLCGAEALQISMAAQVLPADRANELLEALLTELEQRDPDEAYAAHDPDGPRILVTGSVIDHPALLTMIEEEGGVVVADDLCSTSRYFWHSIEPGGDPMEAIWRFLNQRPLCACFHPTEARLEHLLGMIDTFDVEAVVNFNLKYCHPFLYEAPLLKKSLEQRDIPTTVLEVGHDLSGHGQLRTRIQAFIEMLEM